VTLQQVRLGQSHRITFRAGLGGVKDICGVL
jgi:hypothetical protein